LYPVDGGEPRITPMTFNEEGSEANPCGFYTVNVDLRGLYGECNMHATRERSWDITNQPDKITDGEYLVFHNISPKLPINATMARLVGVDPKKPGGRPLWRGDVVVVKTSPWPAPIAIGAGDHMDYLDVPPQALELFTAGAIRHWYNSDVWRDGIKVEQQFIETIRKGEETWPTMQQLYTSGFYEKKYEKTVRMMHRLATHQIEEMKREDLDNIVACGNCYVLGSSLTQPLRVCGGCRNEKYCSTECQKLAWKDHKAACKASQKK